MRSLISIAAASIVAISALPGQASEYGVRGPQFLLAMNAKKTIALDVSRVPALHQRLALDLQGVSLKEAIAQISRRSGIVVWYSDDVLPSNTAVHLRADNITVAAALIDVLLDAGIDIVFWRDGTASLVRRQSATSQGLRLAGAINGRVTDAGTGTAVVGVQISVQGTPLRATTTEAGEYRLANVPAGTHTLQARRIGYVPKSQSVVVPPVGDVVVDLALEAAPTMLATMVSTVTGEQRRSEVGHVVGTVSADSIVSTGSITTLSDLLVGRVSGVQVTLPSGTTGISPAVRIRGVNSISLSNDPLLVVDGIRVSNTTNSASGLQAGFGQTGGRFNDINPSEIESIDIVKGPSAATLYGTDAANGVIVIKTKRGRNSPPRWTGYGVAGTVKPSVGFLDNYYSWGHTPAGVVRQCTLDIAAASVCVIDSLTTFNPFENPITSPIGTGTRQEMGLQVSGGVDRLTYFVSGAGDYEQGYLRMSSADRARVSAERGGATIPEEQVRPNWLSNKRLRANVSVPLGQKADVSLSSGVVLNETSIPSTNIWASGEFGKGYRDVNNGWFPLTGGAPGEGFAVRNIEHVNRFTGSLSSSWRPLAWLAVRGTAGLDLSSNFLDALQRRDEGPASTRTGRRRNVRSNLNLYSVDGGASANFAPRPGWTSTTSLGVQYNRKVDQFTSVTGTGLPPGSETITGASVSADAEQNSEAVVAGAYLEQRLGWQDRVFVTAAVRADGGSSFGRDFQTATYPKVGLSWVAVPNRTGWLNSFRVRMAYGASGVQPGSTAALTLSTISSVVAEGATTAGAVLGAIGNPALKPERTAELEVGFDGRFLRERANLEFTYYDRLSHDALIQFRLPSEVAVPSQWRNIGAVSNRGIEGLLALKLLDANNLGWDLTFNGSANTNKIQRLGFVSPIVAATSGNFEGYALFSRFARPILRYNDANGNGIIEATEVTVGPTPVFVGPSVPPRQLTLTSGVSLPNRGIRVSSQFDRRTGFRQVNVNEINRCSSGFAGNCRAINDPTAPLADQARTIARITGSLGNSAFGYMEDGSFTRWRELAIDADIPQRFARHLRASTASLTLAGRNLALFTNYKGYDPEVNSGGAGIGYSDNPTAPQSRYWLLRLNLGF
jgi:TonB-linked SusC/RagA family outer membrane protein